MTKSDPYHNSYSCPSCEEDVPCALPLAKYVDCPECKTKLEIHVDAEFDGQWHDRTMLSIVECCPECREDRLEREHMQRMIDYAKNKCDDCGKPSETDLCQNCCPHDEHDHGICLECSKDIMDDLIGRAELLEDR